MKTQVCLGDFIAVAARLLTAVHKPVVALYDCLIDDVLNFVTSTKLLKELTKSTYYVIAQHVLHGRLADNVRDYDVNAVLEHFFLCRVFFGLALGNADGSRFLHDKYTKLTDIKELDDLVTVYIKYMRQVISRVPSLASFSTGPTRGQIKPKVQVYDDRRDVSVFFGDVQILIALQCIAVEPVEIIEGVVRNIVRTTRLSQARMSERVSLANQMF